MVLMELLDQLDQVVVLDQVDRQVLQVRVEHLDREEHLDLVVPPDQVVY